jgi:hypothetical protein
MYILSAISDTIIVIFAAQKFCKQFVQHVCENGSYSCAVLNARGTEIELTTTE